MDEKMKLKIEVVINKLLYKKNIIEKDIYEGTARKLDKLIFSKNKEN